MSSASSTSIINDRPGGEPHYYSRRDYQKKTGRDDLMRDPKDKRVFYTPAAWAARARRLQQVTRRATRTIKRKHTTRTEDNSDEKRD